MLKIVWDPIKARANFDKHGVSFAEAASIFARGEEYFVRHDDAHSQFEDRFVAMGRVSRGIVVVVWVERDEDEIRLISARWATRRERAQFNSHGEKAR